MVSKPHHTKLVLWKKKPTTPHWDEFRKLERNDKNFGKEIIILKRIGAKRWFFTNLAKIDDFWNYSNPSANVMRISFEKSKECGSYKSITKKNESWHSWSEMIADHDQIMASLVCGSYLGLENALIVPKAINVILHRTKLPLP